MAEPWTTRRVLDWTTRDFASRGIASPRLDAELLLAHALGSERLALFLDMDRPLTEKERSLFRGFVERRRGREPLAYIVGAKEFWSLPFRVDRRVLVPRPDTEVLVEEALEQLPREGSPLVVDVGTGSGCIASAVATERPGWRLVGCDVEAGALAVAAENLRRHGLRDRVELLRCDLLDPLGGPLDMIVSNPPYIPSGEVAGLDPEVAIHEPRRALDGGDDGLAAYRRLLPAAAGLLRTGGALLVEVGDGVQADAVAALASPPLRLDRVRKDYGEQERVVVLLRE